MIRSDPQRDGAAISAAPSAFGHRAERSRWRVLAPVLLMGAAASVAFGVVLVLFTRSGHFQRLDERARYCTDASGRAWAVAVDPLVGVTIGSLALCLLVSMGIAVARRCTGLAVAAVVVVAGANISTHLVKEHWPTRPHLWSNSLPSGHATAAMSVALAAVLVAAPRWRKNVAVAGAFVSTFVGAGTVVGHWHRPADVVAAFLLCLVWAALAMVVAMVWQRGRGARVRTTHEPMSMRMWAPTAGASLAGLIFIVAGVRPIHHSIKWVEAGITFIAIGVLSAVVLTWAATVADESLG